MSVRMKGYAFDGFDSSYSLGEAAAIDVETECNANMTDRDDGELEVSGGMGLAPDADAAIAWIVDYRVRQSTPRR